MIHVYAVSDREGQGSFALHDFSDLISKVVVTSNTTLPLSDFLTKYDLTHAEVEVFNS